MMETIKVNMTPCEDIKTIHASQNDNEAREWGFELHNNGEKIDSSSISDQMVFKAYEGGTEQILPENGAVPVTAPFVGDIKYPDATRTDQEFLYRESPTEEDGLAWIKSIKGNTLVWNQLVQNGNFADTNRWSATRGTIATSNNILSYTSTAIGGGATQNRLEHNLPVIPTNHKILVRMRVKPAHTTRCVIQVAVNGTKVSVGQISVNGNVWNDISLLYTLPYALDSGSNLWFGCEETSSNGYVIGDVDQYMNVMIFDLTQMGLDITDPSEFTSLFPKPYYDYCKGAMLSFGGRNVKFNQLVENGNFEDASGWVFPNGTGSVSNNVLTATATGTNFQITRGSTYALTQGHKIYISCWIKSSVAKDDVRLRISQNNPLAHVQYISQNLNANVRTNISGIITAESNTTNTRFSIFILNSANGEVYTVDSFVAFDLSEMFGVGNEPSAEGFKELFPNDYYEYTTEQYMNLGQPVSLKTIGFNQWDEELEQGFLNTNTGQPVTSTSYSRSKNFIPILPNEQYYCKALYNVYVFYYDANKNYLGFGSSSVANKIFTPLYQNAHYIKFRYDNSGASYNNDSCINISSSKNGTYEPYTESTLSIPLDEFPNGMDGVNDVHDEKDETGYVKRFATIKVDTVASGSPRNNGDYYASVNGVTNAKPADNGTVANMICNICETMSAGARYNSTKNAVCARTTGSIELCISGITSRADLQTYVDSHDIYITYELATPLENYGVVDLGTLSWQYYSERSNFYAIIPDIAIPANANTKANAECVLGTSITWNEMLANANGNGTYAVTQINTEKRFYIKNTNYSSVTDFMQYVNGVYLLYEKENPQGFTTATIVTENGEVALANENGVLVGKCNSDVSADAGFIEGKIKLSDEDGECYSNKIQLHIERSPQ